MKKISFLLIIFLLSIIMIPTVFAKDEVSIESTELIDNTETTTEVNKPKVDGLNISFDLKFSKVDDYAKYKIIINNKTDKDYEINKDLDFYTSEYITYEYEFESKDSIVPAKKKTIMYITILYEHEISAEKLVNGKFIENNKMALSLSSDTSSISKEAQEKNPNTGNSILIICVLCLSIAFASLILFGRTKRTRYITTCLLSLMLMPTTIFALEKLQINVETKITVQESYKLSIIKETLIKESEASNYILESTLYNVPDEDYCDTTIYLIDGEKYVMCSIVEESTHIPGERINIPVVKQTVVDKWGTVNGVFYENCQEDDVYDYICTSEAIKEIPFEFLSYDKTNNKSLREDDFEIMNIPNSDQSKWQYYKTITIEMPSEFTMPRHDVVFEADFYVT